MTKHPGFLRVTLVFERLDAQYTVLDSRKFGARIDRSTATLNLVDEVDRYVSNTAHIYLPDFINPKDVI